MEWDLFSKLVEVEVFFPDGDFFVQNLLKNHLGGHGTIRLFDDGEDFSVH
jgi:hypothetical protein